MAPEKLDGHSFQIFLLGFTDRNLGMIYWARENVMWTDWIDRQWYWLQTFVNWTLQRDRSGQSKLGKVQRSHSQNGSQSL